MNFKTVAEAFNYWNGKTVKEIETRAQEIKGTIETDPNVDIKSLNIELTGLAQAKENVQEKENQADPEARSFNPITKANFETGSYEATQGDVYASKEYRSAFYKSLMGKELNAVEKQTLNRAIEMEKRADAYTTSGNTPVVIPTTTLNEIISKARAEGGVIGIARAFNMPTKIAIPVATPSSKASWNTEGQAVDSEKPTIAQVTFDAYEIIKVFSISAKVRTMSIDAFEAYLVDELQRCVFETIADSLINGTGTNQGTGLEHGVTWDTSNSVTATKAKGITFKDVVATVAKLKRGYGRGAKWVLNNATLYNAFYGMVDDNGKPIFIADPKDDTVGRILGFDVVVDDYVADNVCYFGNFNYLGYNLANGIAVESSTQSSFKSGKVDYRGMAIADTQVIVPEAFIKLSVATA
nr:MAG TPA: major capsid protein [Caudoviricetes sp.]